ncbi:MAG: zinc metallopeptidase [Hydrogenoanaerobacterium sp.]
MGFDIYYLVLVVPAIILSIWAQAQVKGTFAKFSKIRTIDGATGEQAARAILDGNGLQSVRIEHIAGELTDHFDPRDNVVRLSDSVYASASVAAVGVAAHECGHAVQYAKGYTPMKLRSAIIPVTNIGSKLSIPLVFLGIVLSMGSLINLGIILFSTMTLFQLVTLPVEFNASHRALVTLEGTHMLEDGEISGAKKVLKAAALTYVAALLVSATQLLRMVLITRGRDRD